MKVVLTIEYRGEDYCGFQRQNNGHTVQAEIEQALATFLGAEAKKKGVVCDSSITVNGSGRTDSGVHARKQVVSFFWPETIHCDVVRLVSALNGITNGGITILSAREVTDDFDARRSSHEKCYCYNFLLRDVKQVLDYNRSWRIGTKLDLAAMIAAAKLFKGEHNFRCFRAIDCSAKNSCRVILRSELVRVDAEHLIYLIVGKGFLKQMVRIIAGTLVDVGQGKLSVEEVQRLINPDPALTRNNAGQTAPAYGLSLEWVKY